MKTIAINTILIMSLILASNFSMAETVKTIKKKNSTVKLTTDTIHTTSSAVVHETPKHLSNAFTHEILTNISMGSLNIEKACKNCDSQTTIDLHVSYLHFIQDKIQAGAEGGLNFISGGNSNTYIDVAAVGVYNFDEDFSNAFFAKAGLGIFTVPSTSSSNSSTDTKFGMFIGGGKRFSWLSNVNYIPEARLVKKGDLDLGLEVALVNFSIHW